MKSLIKKMGVLRDAQFLNVALKDENVTSTELLKNGKLFREQIESQWRITGESANDNKNVLHYNQEITEQQNDLNPRLHFIYSQSFRRNMRFIKAVSQEMEKPTMVKMRLHRNNSTNGDNNLNDRNDLTELVTDYFFHAPSGLAKFYNIQRERKIWWMRFSTDPSHYVLEPHELAKADSSNTTQELTNAKSITIKSLLPMGEFCLEHLTLVPLNEAILTNKEDFEIQNAKQDKKQLPAAIRSVIDLDVAASALILDSVASKNRENTIFLNRKLAPFQCLVTCENTGDESSNDLKDLCTHLSNVIRRANLRLFDSIKYMNDSEKIKSKLEISDMLGIPYILLVNRNSLNSGLLKLRSRDTTLEETIHISDIPDYLLNIFRAG